VGGHVTPVKLLQQTRRPVYPEAARAEGREGNVALRAVIGIDGAALNVQQVIAGTADTGFAAAEAAVKQWRYELGRLNAQPVEIVTTLEVSFRLTAGGGA